MIFEDLEHCPMQCNGAVLRNESGLNVMVGLSKNLRMTYHSLTQFIIDSISELNIPQSHIVYWPQLSS